MDQIRNYVIDRDIKFTDFDKYIKFKIDEIQFKVSEDMRGYHIEAQNTDDETMFAIFSGMVSERQAIKNISFLEEELQWDMA